MRAGADFNFLCGIFRSRESALVNAQKLEGMMKASSFMDAVNQMPEGAYGTGLRQNPEAQAIEAGYRAELAEIADILEKFSPRRDFSRLVYLPWDYHNLKASVLHALDGRGGEELFGPEGEVGMKRLAELASAMEFSGLPAHLGKGLERALLAYYQSDKSLQAFELALDRQKRLAALEIAHGLSSRIFEHEVAASDISLASVFFRAYYGGIPWEKTSWAFAGHPDLPRLKILYALKAEDWGGRATSLSRKPLARLFLAARSLESAEAAVDSDRKAHLKSMNDWGYKPPSVEYAWYFLTRRFADLFNLRLVLLCVLNGIQESEYRGKVNDAFL
jgi:vacuolar-type H+-ATPase subunit C/Vma6